MAYKGTLRSLLRGMMERRESLNREEAHGLLDMILAGEASEVELAALLGAMAARGETAAELAGFVDALRAAATPMPLKDDERALMVDTCGTGGDSSGTFNISTAAALVAAASETADGRRLMVAKHGNRAVTSTSGSADVLEAMGIPVDLSPAQSAEALRTHGFAFLHAPAHHPAMKAVMPVRRALGIRTIFNLVGPLSNPAGAQAQVMGVYAADRVPLVAEAMLLLGTRHAFVVHGQDEQGRGLDEISVSGPTRIAEVRDGRVRFETVTPEQFGLARAPLSALQGGDAVENAGILRSIFAGEPGPRRDIVVINAAAVLVAGGLAPGIAEGLKLACATIDQGAVNALIAALGDSKQA